jgi:hypothetical protein
MDMTAEGRQMRYSWLLIGVLAVLCAVLAVVQYRWIDEVAQANRERIKSEREAGLRRVRQEFNDELRSVSAMANFIDAVMVSAYMMTRPLTLRAARPDV